MGLVRENLYNFHKTGDVKSGLNIGIRSKITAWLDKMGVKNYTINDDLSIDVAGNVNLGYKGITEFPHFIRFRMVTGWFDCSNNGLKTLEGCPWKVGINFYCCENQLESLYGCPIEVNHNFWIKENSKNFTEKEIRSVCNIAGRIYN